LKFEETSFNKIYFLERLTGIGIISEEIIENSRLKDIQIEWTKMHKKVLALGSATGYVADILKQFCSMTVLNNLENNLEEEFKKIENRKFDAIVMGDLFGKVNNPEKLLRKLQSVLKNEGCIIFYVPNLSHATNRLKYFNSSQNEKNGNGSNNVNCYNIDSIRSLIENANYHLINSERVNAGIFALKRKNIDPKKISQKTRNEILNESESSTLYYLLKIKKLEFSNTKYDHKEFVEKCYQEFLMRKSDQEGFEHYVALLENKEIDERKLVEIFKNSSEHKKIQDNNIFWI